jgi:6-phosphogluconolactonase
VYRFDASNGSLAPNDPPFTKVDPGSGPRHLAFRPDGKFAYVINELNSTITAFSYADAHGVLKVLQTVSTLPKDFSGNNDAAEIHVHPDGKFLFASNRGHDSIAVFSIAQDTGRLNPAGDFSTQGKTPRNFEIDPSGSRLFVANQDTGTIVIFRIDQKTGGLTPTGKVLNVPSPVSLRFVAVE